MRHGFTSHESRATSHGFFLGFRCGVPPRQTQTDNDASGNPPRVAGRLDRTSLRKRSGGPPADCDLRPAACGLRMAFSPNSISRDSLNGTPSHSCPFWQPSCASCWSAPDGPKRLTGRPLRKRSSGPPRFGRRGGKIVASGSWLVGRPLLTANC